MVKNIAGAVFRIHSVILVIFLKLFLLVRYVALETTHTSDYASLIGPTDYSCRDHRSYSTVTDFAKFLG